MKKGFDKFVKVYTEILCAFGCFFYLAFCICVLIQIISRNLLPSAPSWTEEAARYTFIYMVAFGCGVAILKQRKGALRRCVTSLTLRRMQERWICQLNL